jgi:hypothetical protein
MSFFGLFPSKEERIKELEQEVRDLTKIAYITVKSELKPGEALSLRSPHLIYRGEYYRTIRTPVAEVLQRLMTDLGYELEYVDGAPRKKATAKLTKKKATKKAAKK